MSLASSGVTSSANGLTASLAGSSARAAGPQVLGRRAEHVGEALDLAERRGRLRSVLGSSPTAAEMFCSSEANARSTRGRGVDEVGEVVVVAAPARR